MVLFGNMPRRVDHKPSKCLADGPNFPLWLVMVILPPSLIREILTRAIEIATYCIRASAIPDYTEANMILQPNVHQHAVDFPVVNPEYRQSALKNGSVYPCSSLLF